MADSNFVPNTSGGSTFRGIDGGVLNVIQEVVRVSWGPNTAENLVDDVAGKRLPVLSAAQPGVDIGDVTVNNAAGASAVNIQDGGNSITIDGSVSVSGTVVVDQVDTASIDYDTGGATVNQTVIGIALPASGGPVAGGTATNPIRTDPTGTTTQPVSGTVTANAGTGTFAVDTELPAAETPADNLTNATAAPRVNGLNYVFDGTAWDRLPGDSVNGALVNLGANNDIVGAAAHDAAAAGNPLLCGAIAEVPEDTAPANQVSADGDAVRIAASRDGAIYTHPHPPRIWHVSAEHTTAQTDTTVKAAPGAGLSLYITDIVIHCNGAVTVSLEEGTTTLKFRYYGNGIGDGSAPSFKCPIKLTANTALTVTTSAAVTTFVLVSGYTAP